MCQSSSTPTKEANCGTPRISFKLPSLDAEISTERCATTTRENQLRYYRKLKKKKQRETPRLQLPDPFRASSISLEGNSAVRRRFEGVVVLHVERDRPATNSRSSSGSREEGRQQESGEESNMPRTSRRWLVHRARDVKRRRVILRKGPGHRAPSDRVITCRR